MKPKVLILFATGTNRDIDAQHAFQTAGAQAEIVHINQLRAGERKWEDYQILVLPGGFSYADALGAGRLLALDLVHYFKDEVQAFVDSGKPVIGICNGFQALVKSGILPDVSENGSKPATLTFNDSGNFECRWVTLQPVSEKCIWTQNLQEPVDCPVAHGEGNYVVVSADHAQNLKNRDHIAFTYCKPDGTPANGAYPFNPNGSILDIAGICNEKGNVLGMMPHPEDHIFAYQHPEWTRGTRRFSGLPLFENGVKYVSNS